MAIVSSSNPPIEPLEVISPDATCEVATDTGERDENYDLISVLYNALRSAESCAKYVQDAARQGDEQLAQFFEEARGSHVELAQQAKQLLAMRLLASEGEEAEDRA